MCPDCGSGRGVAVRRAEGCQSPRAPTGDGTIDDYVEVEAEAVKGGAAKALLANSVLSNGCSRRTRSRVDDLALCANVLGAGPWRGLRRRAWGKGPRVSLVLLS